MQYRLLTALIPDYKSSFSTFNGDKHFLPSQMSNLHTELDVTYNPITFASLLIITKLPEAK
jgi:hypothetical protein